VGVLGRPRPRSRLRQGGDCEQSTRPTLNREPSPRVVCSKHEHSHCLKVSEAPISVEWMFSRTLLGGHHDGARLDAAVDDEAGMQQRRLLNALHAERERLAQEQLTIDAKWDNAENEKARLQEHLTSTTRTLEDTRQGGCSEPAHHRR